MEQTQEEREYLLKLARNLSKIKLFKQLFIEHIKKDMKSYSTYFVLREAIENINDHNNNYDLFLSIAKEKAINISQNGEIINMVDFETNDRFNTQLKIMENDNLKNDLKQKFFQKNYPLLTEMIVQYIKENNKIYTIRDDINYEMWIYKNGVYIPNGKSYIIEICRLLMNENYKEYFSNIVIDKIVSDTLIDNEKFFDSCYPDLVPCLNGIYDIKQDKLLDFNPDFIFFNKINAKYDPNVKFKGSHIDNFFSDVVIDIDKLKLQEIIGYCLFKAYPVQKAFILLGVGSNGKTITIKLLKNFLGSQNCSSVTLNHMQNENTFSLSEMHNKLANLIGELSKKTLQDMETFKSLTGDEGKLPADRKFKNRIYFTNYAKIISSCNQLPISKDLTDAFFRRWVTIDFINRYYPINEYNQLSEEQKKNPLNKIADTNLTQKIITETELSGLLNWALIGLNRVLNGKHHLNDESTESVKKKWKLKSNTFEAFLDNCIEINEHTYAHFIKKDELKEHYALFCAKNKVRIENDKVIHHSLESLGCWDEMKHDKENQHFYRVWRNIKLKDEYTNNYTNIVIPLGQQAKQGFSDSMEISNFANKRIENACFGCLPCYSPILLYTLPHQETIIINKIEEVIHNPVGYVVSILKSKKEMEITEAFEKTITKMLETGIVYHSKPNHIKLLE